MPANKLVSHQQMEVMLDYLEANRGFAVGRLSNSGPLAKQEMSRRWEELALMLNAVAVGATKSGAKWREYWNEKKYAVRRKASELRQHAQGTGGGPAKGKLTDLEERILAILGKVAVHGNPTVRIPFEVNTPAPLPSQDSQNTSPLMVTSSPPVTASPPVTDFLPTSELSTLEHAPLQNTIFLSPPRDAEPARASSRLRPNVQHIATVPHWALEIEERRVAAEERQAQAIERLAQAMERQTQTMEIISNTLGEIKKTMANTKRS